MPPFVLRYALFLLAMLLAVPQPGQGQRIQPLSLRFYGKAADETGGKAVALPGGGYLLVGERALSNLSSTLYLVRTTALGDTLWTRTYTPPQLNQPYVYGATLDGAGNIVVSGSEQQQGFVTKFTAAGVPIWNYLISLTNTSAGGIGVFAPIILSDGNYAVNYLEGGFFPTVPQTTFYDQHILKLDSNTGTLIWKKAFSPYFAGMGYHPTTSLVGVAAVPNGILAFVEGDIKVTQAYEPATMTLDNNGNITSFKKRLPAQFKSQPTRTISTSTGVYMAQRQSVSKYTFSGDTLWHTPVPARYANRQWDATALALDGQGNVLVLSNSVFAAAGPAGGDHQLHLTRLTAGGRLLTDTMLYRTPNNYGASLFVAANGEIVLTGSTTASQYGGSDLFLARFSAFRPLATAAGASAPAAGLRCFPNPASGAGAVQVGLPAPAGAGTRLEVYDGLGRRCRTQAVAAGAGSASLAVAGLPPGLYVLRLLGPGGGPALTTRLVRE